MELLLNGIDAITGLGVALVVLMGANVLQEKLHLTKFTLADDIFKEVVTVTVGKIEQLTAKDLRLLVKDGKASKSELLALANQAYSDITDTLSPRILQILNKHFGDPETYIHNAIEAELFKLKSNSQ